MLLFFALFRSYFHVLGKTVHCEKGTNTHFLTIPNRLLIAISTKVMETLGKYTWKSVSSSRWSRKLVQENLEEANLID